MSSSRRSVLFAFVLGLGACATTAPDPNAQSIVESLASTHPAVVRLTLHAIPQGGTDYVAVASTSEAKLGRRSDPEDMRAMESGEVIVLDEAAGTDVTVPIRYKDGEYVAAVGVTIDGSMEREAAIAQGKAIAAAIDRAWTESPDLQ